MLGTPGLKLAVASGARTAYGLTRAAIRDNNPVVLLEPPRALSGEREEVDVGEGAIIELGTAETVRAKGSDVTLVALGQQLLKPWPSTPATAAWSGEVIDLAHLDAVGQRVHRGRSVRRTGRLVVVEENQGYRRLGNGDRVVRVLGR